MVSKRSWLQWRLRERRLVPEASLLALVHMVLQSWTTGYYKRPPNMATNIRKAPGRFRWVGLVGFPAIAAAAAWTGPR